MIQLTVSAPDGRWIGRVDRPMWKSRRLLTRTSPGDQSEFQQLPFDLFTLGTRRIILTLV